MRSNMFRVDDAKVLQINLLLIPGILAGQETGYPLELTSRETKGIIILRGKFIVRFD